jgi:hypothetical protein
MIINLDELEVDYRNNGGRDETIDDEQYGVLINIECFLLIRELINAHKKLRTEINELRNEVNELAPCGEELPYPQTVYDMPGTSYYVNELIRTLYKGIFDEDAQCY